jgi:hypothetical protein
MPRVAFSPSARSDAKSGTRAGDAVDADRLTSDPVQLANALKSFAELHQNKAISDEDYNRIRTRVLAAMERLLTPEPTSTLPMTAVPRPPQDVQDYAGVLHRLITDKLAAEYPEGDNVTSDDRKRYLIATVTLLLANGALYPSDRLRMERLIETVTDTQFASSLERMVQGQDQLDQMHREARLSVDSSALAKTITCIASDSAQKAVAMEAAAPPAPPEDPVVVAAATQRRARRWGVVLVDVTGAFTGAGTAATIMAGPGFPAIALGVAAVLGSAAVVLPAFGAIIGGSMTSGAELRRTRL